jgi:fructuronate reductase
MGQIVHFGLGNFARAHLLDFTADAGGWNVVGVSLRSAGIRDGLKEQAFDYDLCIHGQDTKRITILSDVLVASEDVNAIFEAMAEADIFSATVTEKGYHLDTAGELDISDPAIASDLTGVGPTTLIGFIARGLAARHTPVTVLSCDNRVENGATLKAAIKRFCALAGIEVDWSLVSFPNAMVDRITPATTDAVRAISGDPMAVPTEGFREWVIEDNFSGPRPDWPDAQFVANVAPHELRKLRMLNGAHSTLAYAGLAKGHSFVHEAIADQELRGLTEQLMTQASATLPAEVQEQAPEYAKALIRRFETVELAHSLRQIAMDGSQKVPYRLIGTLRDLLQTSKPSNAVISGIQAWLDFCITETGQGNKLDDPKADEIAKAAQADQPKSALLALIGAADLTAIILE